MLPSVIRAWRSHEAVGETGKPISKAGSQEHPKVSDGFTLTAALLGTRLIQAGL